MKTILLLLFFSLPVFSQSADDELINPKELIPDLVVDLRYTANDHYFLNLPNGDVKLPKFYTNNETLIILRAAKMLKTAQDSLRNIKSFNGNSYPEGIGLKIWDGYRPRSVQYLLFEIFPNPVYVADPNSGSMHNRGGAIDLTLIDLSTGEELEMPTEFDDFSDAAGLGYNDLPQHIINNREMLKSVMQYAGFLTYSAEWWHYNVPGANTYPLRDYQLK